MRPDTLARWIADDPWPAAAAAALTLAALAAAGWLTVRAARRALHAAGRPPAAVVVTAIGAAVCTAYTADTSWHFAAHRLGMSRLTERGLMFAAAELGLFACGLMARQNLRTTGTPGTPGVLVWVITGVQVIPAYSESGVIGGTVRAVVGPIMSALLWHLAMGIELRHAKPGADSQSLPAVLAREVRERLLSRLGLAVRGRDAIQITRDRWTDRAVDHAARLAELAPADRTGRRGRRLARRLDAAVARSGAGDHPQQRTRLLHLLAARRHATALATIALPSPWELQPERTRPRTLPALAHRELTHMHPIDAIRTVADAHPTLTPAQLTAECIAHGLVVTEMQVRIATGAGSPPPPTRTRPHPDAPAPAVERTPDAPGQAEPCIPDAPAPAPERTGLVLHLRTAPGVHPDVTAPPLVIAAGQHTDAVHATIPDAHPNADDGAPDPLLAQARALGTGNQIPTLRTLQTELRIGQARAQRLQRALARGA